MLLRKPYVLRRVLSGGYQANGYYAAARQDKVVYLNLQPYQERGQSQSDSGVEGTSSTRRLQGFGKDEIRTVEQYNSTLADRVCYNGRWFVCLVAEKWDGGFFIDHYKSIWAELPSKEQEPPITPKEVPPV